ncbi:MAG: PDZ domain-containing protein [Chitinophagaceae bacterium]|nr:PDZ domain-containing protein [Chitinophagaceae bacterium]
MTEEKKEAGNPCKCRRYLCYGCSNRWWRICGWHPKGRYLIKVNGVDISNGAEMQGPISRQKPGDKITISYIRNGSEKRSANLKK